MFVVLIGNPIDGSAIYGPFATAQDAEDWADGAQDDYWIVPLQSPTEG